MKKGLKKVAVVLLTLLLAVVVTGCGSSKGASDSEKSKDGKEKVVFWSWQPTDKQMAKLKPAFEKKYPDIELEYWRGELPDYQKKLQVAMASGEGPDLIGVQTGAMLNQYSKLLEPLDSVAEKQFGKNWEDKFLESSLAECADKDGKYVALPVNASGQQFVMYNKTIFDEAGITAIPKTYEEWKQIVQTLKEKEPDLIPVVYGAKEPDKCVDMFNALSQQFGPGKFEEAEQGKVKWTSDVFVKTMEAWKQMFDDKMFQDGAIGLTMYPDASIKYFFVRKATMFMTGTWQLGSITEGGPKFDGPTKDDEFGMFILPQIGPHEPQAVVSTDIAVALNKNAKHRDAAIKLLEFMTQGEGSQIMADELNGTVANANVKAESVDQFTSQTEKDIASYTSEYVAKSEHKRLLNNNELVQALGVAMQDVVSGKDVKTALQEVQDTFEGLE